MTLYILTGAPGTGKSAIIGRLNSDISTFAEPAREVIADYRTMHGPDSGQPPAQLFVDLLLERSIENYEAAQRAKGVIVFDRGVPDCVAYAEWLGVDPAPSIEAAARFPYNPEALVMRPWEEIYTTDDERTMTFDMVVGFHEVVEDVFERLGYRLVEVPRGSIEERTTFVRQFVKRG